MTTAGDREANVKVDRPASLTPAIITPVWGEIHVRRFLDLVLPTWLAPGNLPAFAAGGRPQMIVLTRLRDIPLFERSHSFSSLSQLVDPQFVSMEDLIGPSGMPVTLTLAYARGLGRLCASAARRPVALLNADFLLADGSLRTLRRAFDAGARSVLAPSLRVIEEEVAGDLLLGVKDNVLALPPRTLTAMALKALHPTVLSSRVDQELFWSANPNQLFWRPTPDLMIGRSFCMFLLGAAVAGPIGPVGSYCDYGMADQLVGDEAPVVFGDSDRFLAVELGPLAQESAFFQSGKPTAETVGEKLSIWTTQFHRDQARHVITYKAADPPDDLDALVAPSDAFLDTVFSHLQPAQPLLEHPHWLGGVGAWRVAREYRGVFHDPPELAPTRDIRLRAPGATNSALRRLARAAFFGEPGQRRARHPYWRLERRLAQWRTRLPAGEVAAVGGASAIAFLTGPMSGPEMRLDKAAAALALLDLASSDRVRQLVDEARGVGPDRPLLLTVLKTGEDDISPMAFAELASLLDQDFRLEAVEFFDLRRDRRAETAHGALADARNLSPLVLARLAARSGAHALKLAVADRLTAMGLLPPPRGALSAALILCRRRTAPPSSQRHEKSRAA